MAEAAISWINKGTNALPDWVCERQCGKREPNGSFLIKTRRPRRVRKDQGGADTFEELQARVLVGNIVVQWGDFLSTCPVSEAKEHLAELERELAPVPQPDERVKRATSSPATPPAPIPPSSPGKPAKAARPQPERKRAYPPPLGTRPSIEWLHLDRLSLDAEYQRATDNQASQRLIKKIAAGFDWRLCPPLFVSKREEEVFVVIDGQHRLLAARLRGMDDLPCCIFRFASVEEEAKMFIAANRSRKPMNRLDDFHAALVAADDEAHLIRQIVEDAGLKIARNTSSTAWAPGEIAFTGSIASTVRKHGEDIARQALNLIGEAFPDAKLVHSGSLFGGLVKFITSPPEGFDNNRLFRTLLKFEPDAWGEFVAGLKGGDTRATAIRDAIAMAYEETPITEGATP